MRRFGLLVAALATAHAFHVPLPRASASVRRASGSMRRATVVVAEEQDMAEMATAAIDTLMGMLGDDTAPPKTLVPLKQAIQSGEGDAISKELYCVLVEQTLDYDVEDSKLVPTSVDYKNLTDPKVREKCSYIYSYGITMFKRDMIAGEVLKEIVLECIAGRIGMSGEEFDQWLDIPKVE